MRPFGAHQPAQPFEPRWKLQRHRPPHAGRVLILARPTVPQGSR
ncbi:hypothetical protein NSERUTF1_1044 [Nocardia seriolae]|nr:hypothetical protein NSERUTF1_1044 [Nocardia seriolae]